MEYELAKELKEAGFIQKGEGMFVGNVGLVKPENFTPGGIVGIAQEDFLYLPTLSELIAACGKDFGALKYGSATKWIACGGEDRTIAHEEENYEFERLGDTPEIAVTRLWLSLRKNEQG